MWMNMELKKSIDHTIPNNMSRRAAHALKTAIDFESVGNKRMALGSLQRFLEENRGRRAAQQWTEKHEQVAKRFLDLCLELREADAARDGLFRYRQMVESANRENLRDVVVSFQRVVEHMIAKCTLRAEEGRREMERELARLEAGGGAAESKEGEGGEEEEEDDDGAMAEEDALEDGVNPEAIMLSLVSTTNSRAKLERRLVLPWVRFAYDVFSAALNQLRWMKLLSKAYHMTAACAAKFLLDFERPADLRRLCRSLSRQLDRFMSDYRDSIDKAERDIVADESAPQPAPHEIVPRAVQENISSHIQTRVLLLEACTALKLWREAFELLKHIHALTILGRQKPTPRLLIEYYDKLARVFWASGDLLHHAYARFRQYQVIGTVHTDLPKGIMTLLSSRVVLAALAVPLFETDPAGAAASGEGSDALRSRKTQLADLLILRDAALPSREGLMASLRSHHVVAQASSPVQSLFQLVERAFAPLTLAKTAAPLLKQIQDGVEVGEVGEGVDSSPQFAPELLQSDVAEYDAALKRLIVVRTLQQLDGVYATVRISHFRELCAPLEITPYDIESFVLEAVRGRLLPVRIDHRNGIMHLGEVSFESGSLSAQLTRLASRLSRVITLIHTRSPTGAISSESPEEEHLEHTPDDRAEVFAEARKFAKEDHARLLDRPRFLKHKEEQLEKRIHQFEIRARREQQMLVERNKDRERREREHQAKVEKAEKERREAMKREEERKKEEARMAEKLAREQAIARQIKDHALVLDHLTRSLRAAEAPVVEDLQRSMERGFEAYYTEQESAVSSHALEQWKRDQELKRRASKVPLPIVDLVRKKIVDERVAEAEKEIAEEQERARARFYRAKYERALARKRHAEAQAATEPSLRDVTGGMADYQAEKRAKEMEMLRRAEREAGMLGRPGAGGTGFGAADADDAWRSGAPAAASASSSTPPSSTAPSSDAWRPSSSSSSPPPSTAAVPPSASATAPSRWRESGSGSGGGGGGGGKYVPPAARAAAAASSTPPAPSGGGGGGGDRWADLRGGGSTRRPSPSSSSSSSSKPDSGGGGWRRG